MQSTANSKQSGHCDFKVKELLILSEAKYAFKAFAREVVLLQVALANLLLTQLLV